MIRKLSKCPTWRLVLMLISMAIAQPGSAQTQCQDDGFDQFPNCCVQVSPGTLSNIPFPAVATSGNCAWNSLISCFAVQSETAVYSMNAPVPYPVGASYP